MVIGDRVTVYKNGVKLHRNEIKALQNGMNKAYHDGMEAYDNTSKPYRNASKTNSRRHRKGAVSSQDKKGVKSSESLAIKVEEKATK